MALRRTIKNRRHRSRVHSSFDLQITSLMDILVILVVFLLKSYATSLNTFTPIQGIEIPKSMAEIVPPDSSVVIVTPESITFENDRILEFVQTAGDVGSSAPTYVFKKTDLDEGGHRIVALYDALMRSREKSERLRLKSSARDASGNPLPFDGILAIQADRRIDYDTVRRVMYTAATAGYKTFRFLALKKDM